MILFESGEDYLETILILSNNNETVRAIDIANSMSYTKASVSVALKKLREKRLITVDGLSNIHLTDEGSKIATTIYERHKVISSFLIMIGVDEKTAMKDACKIEHDLSNISFEKLKEHINLKSE